MPHASIIVFFIFIVLPLTELYLLFKIAAIIGGLETFLLVVITGIVGASLARAQGIACLERIRASMNKAQLPTLEMASGVLILAASLLLITPGVVTDLVGFSLLIPPLRKALVHLVIHIMKQQSNFSEIHVTQPRQNPASNTTQTDDAIEVEAEIIDEKEL